jgi:lysophospholipase L1-like esterase
VTARTPPVSAAAESLAVRANLVRIGLVCIMVRMPESDDLVPVMDAFVALGDSFTEGLNDPDPGGGFRGWADRVAGALAVQRPGFRYANLAVRGKLLGQVVAGQVPRAVELAPDLVSLAAGGNDILRGSDVDVLASVFEQAVATLQAAGCRVVIFTGFDPRMFPVIRLLRGRIAAYNMHLRGIADACGCDLVDLWSLRALKDARAWSPDRLHLSTEGHRHVARRTCEVLGIPVPGAGQLPVPPAAGHALASRGRWLAARRQDARWAREYAAPWVRRRLGGTSSGDGILPKRPDLLPV